MTRLQGRTAIVTGGAAGIGRGIVLRLIAEGATVCVADVNEAAGAAVVAECGPSAFFVRTDVSNPGAVDSMVAATVDRWGRIDILCNNAGIADYGATPAITHEAWRKLMSIDLDGVFYGCKAILPHMIAARRGAIVNTASIAGMLGFAGMTAYSAAKGAVINYTRSVALDHARDGIRVNAICPGLIATDMTAAMRGTPAKLRDLTDRVPMGREADPAEVAAAVAFLVSDDASYITGCILPIDGGSSCAMRQADPA